MTPEEFLHELGSAAGVPREALAEAVAAPEALRPRISELASKAAAGVWLLPDDAQLLVRGVVALAAARDTASWPILRDLLRLPDDEIDWLIGAGAAEMLGRIALSLWDGDADDILGLMTGPDVGWQARWGLFQAVARLGCDGAIDRKRIARHLEEFERAATIDGASLAWLGWEYAVSHLGLMHLKPALERAWTVKSVFADHREVDRAEVLRVLEFAAANPGDPHELSQDRIAPIDDPMAALEWLERQNDFIREMEARETGDGDSARQGRGDANSRPGLSDFELDWLAGFLSSRQLPETSMNLEMLDGFFTALVAGPDVVPPSVYLDTVLGIDGSGAAPAFDSKAQAQFVMDLMMRRWNEIAQGLMLAEPVAALLVDHGDRLTGRDWADGFLTGVGHHASLRGSAREEARASDLVDPIAALMGEAFYGARVSRARREKILDDLPEIILRCARAWRPNAIPGAAPVEPARSAKVGRNTPCPCGSGRKFKKCCGGSGTGTVH